MCFCLVSYPLYSCLSPIIPPLYSCLSLPVSLQLFISLYLYQYPSNYLYPVYHPLYIHLLMHERYIPPIMAMYQKTSLFFFYLNGIEVVPVCGTMVVWSNRHILHHPSNIFDIFRVANHFVVFSL